MNGDKGFIAGWHNCINGTATPTVPAGHGYSAQTPEMFTTTARLKRDMGVYGLSIAVGKAGDEVGVQKQSNGFWLTTSGPLKGCVVRTDDLDFSL